jgi:PAS domain S-box-containing protein
MASKPFCGYPVGMTGLASQIELRDIIETIPAMAWAVNPDGSDMRVNKRWREYTGIWTDEVHVGLIPTVIHPDDQSRHAAICSRSLETREAFENEIRIRRAADGAYRWFVAHGVPLLDTGGTVIKWFSYVTDIEDRKRAEIDRDRSEQALRRSEAYLAEAQRLSCTGSFGWKIPTDEHFWSDETFRIFEFAPSSHISLQRVLERVHPQDLPSMNTAIAAAQRGDNIEFEYRLLMPDGRIKYLDVKGKAERDEHGGIEIIGAVMDITARKLTELELRRSRAHLADAQKLSRVGSVGMEVNTKRLFWSDEAARIYGYPPGTEPTPELLLQRSHPDDVEGLKDILERAARGGTDFEWRHRLLMPDGSIKHLHDLSHSVTDQAGNAEIVGAIMDVTEQKHAEEERDRARRLESEHETAVITERTRLAGEIHDSLAQALAMIVMQLADAEAKLGPAWSQADRPLSIVRELAVESLAYARRSVSMLQPNVATGGLARSLRDIVDSVRRHFAESLVLDVTGDPVLLDATVESALAGIAREALANAVKHSGATSIEVDLDFAAGGGVRVVVSDNGVGFDPNVVRKDAYGLVSMHERAARGPVALTLVTEPGAGTTIVASWSRSG